MIKGNTDITLRLQPNAVNDNKGGSFYSYCCLRKVFDGVESQMKRTGVCL